MFVNPDDIDLKGEITLNSLLGKAEWSEVTVNTITDSRAWGGNPSLEIDELIVQKKIFQTLNTAVQKCSHSTDHALLIQRYSHNTYKVMSQQYFILIQY